MEYLEDNRNKQILSYLEGRKAASLVKIAEKLKVSVKTIKNSIKEINIILNGSAYIEVKEDKATLFILHIPEFKQRKKAFYEKKDAMNSPLCRYGYILKTLMNASTPILIDQLALDMNMGRTTLIADMNKLRGMLKEYHLNIQGKTNNGIVLEGNEFDLRFFILNNLFTSIYAEDEAADELHEVVNEVATMYHLDKMTSDNLYRTLVVCIDRMQHGNTLSKLDHKYYDLKENVSFLIVNQLLDEMSFLFEFEYNDEEAIFLSLPIIGMRTPMQKENYEFVVITEEIAELVLDILEIISQEMSFHISPTDLLDDFAYHIGFMLQRSKYGIKLKNVSLMEAKEKYPLAFQMGELAKRVIENKTSYRISDDELGFLSSYFGIFLEEQKYSSAKDFKVAIISGSNRMTGKMIEMQLRKILGKETSYDIISSSEVTKSKLDTFDLIISVLGSEYETHVPIVYAKDIFDEHEVARKIEHIRLAKKLDIPVISDVNSYLAVLLEKNRFFLLKKDVDDHENLMYMVECLKQQHVIDDGFIESLCERERKGSIRFGEDILFPHIIHNGNKIIFAIGVLEDAKKEQSKIIFLLGLPNDKEVADEVLMGVYDNIINISSNETLRLGISRLKSEQEFLMYMIKNCEYFK